MAFKPSERIQDPILCLRALNSPSGCLQLSLLTISHDQCVCPKAQTLTGAPQHGSFVSSVAKADSVGPLAYFGSAVPIVGA